MYVISPSNFSEQSPKKNCKFYLWREKKPLSWPTFSHRSYCLNHFCHFSKAYRNLYLFNKMLIYASGKRSVECAYMLRWLLFHFGSEFCINLKNGINFPPQKDIKYSTERKKKVPIYHVAPITTEWCIVITTFFNWQASGMLWELVTRWWISFSILSGWSNKPKADIDICHSTLESYRLLCWLVKYFTSL